MASRLVRHWKVLGIATVALVGALSLPVWQPTLTAQPPSSGVAAGGPCRVSAQLPDRTKPSLTCPAPPNTFDGSSFFGDGATPQSMLLAGPTIDAWAWESFAAFNWPAKVDGSQPTGYLRGVPDLTRTFTDAANTDVLVWETFKEKREVFNPQVKAGQWQDLTFSQEQALNIQFTPFGQGQVPPCTPEDHEAALKLGPASHRRVLQAGKLGPSIDGDNTLDETAEVASPPQEAQSALCAGYTGSALTACQGFFPNPPGGTASTPFPPTLPNPRTPVGPRVFEAATGDILYYEVKLNYDYYNFVTAPPKLPNGNSPPGPYNIDANAQAVGRAPSKQMNLPYRTSSNTTPNITSPQPPLSVLSYDADDVAKAYAGSPATPPPIGSVQIKTGWKLLTPRDTAASFHVSDAVYFSTPAPNQVCYRVGKFGLIGIHIIQRVHLGSEFNTAQPQGGTYIFATWEHNSIGDGAPYKYINFLTDSGMAQTDPMPYPMTHFPIQVKRQAHGSNEGPLTPYPLASTQKVTNAVWSQLGGSFWRNYRLIGTQFLAIGSEPDSLKYNQPYYLANLVIETNDGLQSFQGLPPKVTPAPPYLQSGFKKTTTSFEPRFSNVSSNGNLYVMGGCMGCHGVAQINGFNFSFVLQDGQRGADIDTPTHFAIPPQPEPDTN